MDDFIELDSAKGEWLLDLVAHRQWQAGELVDKSSNDEAERDQKYDDLRMEATYIYYQLLDVTKNIPVRNNVRLFRYLQGESLDDIAFSECPPVSRQAIHKCLRIAVRDIGVGVKTTRAVWAWGQSVYVSTAICSQG